MDINQVLEAHGVLGGGGSSGVKKIYSLIMQTSEPENPKQGDIWVNPINTVTKTTLALDKVASPVDGELLLQFEHVVYQMNFDKLSNKINGNGNSTVYIFNINNLVQETVNNNFIPLFQQDVVKEYAVLKNIFQYQASTDEWLIPLSYYYDGTAWINMGYRLHLQNYNYTIEKRLPGTLAQSEQTGAIPNSSGIFQANLDGTYYGKRMSSPNFIIEKFSVTGAVISTVTISTTNVSGINYYPANIDYVDDFGNLYVQMSTGSNSSIVQTSQYLFKFSSDGTFIYKVMFSFMSLFVGAGNNYLAFRTYDSATPATYVTIVNANTGTFAKTQIGISSGTMHAFEFTNDYFYIAIAHASYLYINKYGYDATLIGGYSFANTYFNNPNAGAKIYVVKDKVLANTFIIYYSPMGTSWQDTFTKLSASSWADDGTTHGSGATVIFKINLAFTGVAANNLPQMTNDENNNLFIVQNKDVRKYDKDGNLLTSIQLANAFQQNLTTYTVAYRYNLFKYNKG